MIGGRDQIIEHLNKQPDDDSIYNCKEIKETRSQAQNRLYHKRLRDLVGELGEKGIFITTNDLHDGLREKLIESKYKYNPVTKEQVLKQKTTTKLSKTEFSKYLKDIEKYLWQTFEVTHPMPTDLFYKN